MKRISLLAATLVAILFAASCQQENLEPVQAGSTVTFTVEVPEVATKGIGDDISNINNIAYAVYRTDDDNLEDALQNWDKVVRFYQVDEQTTFVNGSTHVTLELVNDQKYVVLFWAQVGNTWVPAENFDLTKITYPAEPKANQADYAAFSGVAYLKKIEGSRAEKVTLTRPFAQINIAAKDPKHYDVNIATTKVTVFGAGNSFNVASQAASETANVVFDAMAKPTTEAFTVNEVTYDHYLAMNYVFANGNVDVTYEIDAGNHGIVKNTVPAVPVKTNYRTNIVGNLLTSSVEYTVTLDNVWGTPEYVLGEEWAQTGEYEYTIYDGASTGALKEVLDHADAEANKVTTKADGPVVTIELEGNVEWATGGGHASSPLLPATSNISKVVINGNGNTFTATGSGVGSIRLANGGLLEFNDVNIVDKSVTYNEAAWELTYLEFAGKLAFNECTFNSGVQFQTEGEEEVLNASFTGCHFITNEESVYAVWISDGTTTFNGCSFEGTRGLKMHEDYGSEVVSVTVDGCTFGPLSKKPGIAIGTVNAETSVTIKNSKFDRCQAGDQDNYMYESDTDVITFTFVLENNTVIPSGEGVIDQGNGTAAVATSESLDEALQSDFTTIKLAPGEYIIPSSAQRKTVTFIGTGDPEDVQVAVTKVGTGGENCDYGLDGSDVVFENITITTNSSTYIGYARCNGTYNNCIINGTYTLYGNSVFNNCTLNVSGDVYNIWTWGAPTAEFNNCTFNSDGKAMLLYGEVPSTKLTMNNCIFNDKDGLTAKKAAIEIGAHNSCKRELIVTNATVNGYEINDEGINTGTTLWANKNSMSPELLSVKIDGLQWIGGLLYKDEEGNIIVNSLETLNQALAFANEGTTNIKIVDNIEGDVTIAQAANTTINIDGQNHSYSGVITVDGKSATYTSAGLTIKGLTFNATSISADACINLGKEGDNNTRYTCNVAVENCTFDVQDAVGVKSYTGGDKNLKIKGCTATSKTHSLVQAKGIDGILVEKCEIKSKNGLNFNNSTNVTVNECNADVRGYAARFGEGDKATGAVEVYYIKNSTLKSACEDGDAVIVLRGTADESTLTITNTSLVGTTPITNSATDAKVIVDGGEYVANGVTKKDGEYNVSNAAGLAYFSSKTVEDGAVINLTSDIDFNNGEFMAIAAGYSKSFTFNGNNHIISNIKLAKCGHNSVGAASLFFCYTGGTINISNLTVDNATSEGATYCGVILGYTQGNATVKNVTVQNSNVSGVKKIGGLVGFVEASTSSFLAENCKIINTTVTATEKQAGTIIGYNAKPATLKNCTVENSTATAPEYCDGGVRCTDPAQAALTIE